MSTVLEISALRKGFHNFLLDNISFSLEGGYIMGFIGENGAGKTTTLKAILNILVKDSGDVKVFGLDHIRYEKQIKDRIGFVGDEKVFYEDMTIRKMKNIIAPFYSRWDDKVFHHYAGRFGLSLDRKIKELSQGTYKKLALAIALSHQPELLILDEPTANLDPVFRSEFLDILREFVSDERHAVLFSTHITSDLDKIADYVTFIHQGRIHFSLSREELLDQYRLIKGRRELLDKIAAGALIGVQSGPYGFEGLGSDPVAIQRLAEAGCVVEKPSIEDIMVHTVREGRK